MITLHEFNENLLIFYKNKDTFTKYYVLEDSGTPKHLHALRVNLSYSRIGHLSSYL